MRDRRSGLPGASASGHAEASDGLGLRAVLDAAAADKWILAAFAGVGIAVGGAYALFATPVYEAEALVQVERQRGSMPGFEDWSGMDRDAGRAGAEAQTRTEMEILRSRLILGQVVSALNLEIRAEPIRAPIVGGLLARAYGGEGPAPPRFGASGYAWGGEEVRVEELRIADERGSESWILEAGEGDAFTVFGEEGDALVSGTTGRRVEGARAEDGAPEIVIEVAELEARPGTRFRLQRQRAHAAARHLRGRLQIDEQAAGTGILELSLEDEDPEAAQKILNEIIDTYVAQDVERRSAEARQSLDFLDDKLPEVREDVEAAEEAFNDFRRRHRALDLDADTENLLGRIVEVESELAELELTRVEAARRFTDEHPRMQTLANKEDELRSTKAALERRVDRLPDQEQEELRLRREVDVATDLYTNLLNTAQELRVAEAGTIGNVRTLDSAVEPRAPVRPDRLVVGGMSSVLGLLIGVGFACSRRALRRGVHDPDALEQALGLPVCGVIPHSPREQRAAGRRRSEHRRGPILAAEHAEDPAVEALRSLRTSLLFAHLEADQSVIAFASPRGAGGESFVCTNAGYVFAESGKRVLVVDADLRRGGLHAHFHRDRSPGLSEVLSGRAEFRDAVRVVRDRDGAADALGGGASGAGGGRLDVIPTGALPSNPSELLMDGALERLIEEARAAYDLVLIDTPPVLAVTDAAVVGAYASAVLMVVRAGHSSIQEVEGAIKRLHHSRVEVTGLVFNDLNAREARGAGYT